MPTDDKIHDYLVRAVSIAIVKIAMDFKEEEDIVEAIINTAKQVYVEKKAFWKDELDPEAFDNIIAGETWSRAGENSITIRIMEVPKVRNMLVAYQRIIDEQAEHYINHQKPHSHKAHSMRVWKQLYKVMEEH